MKHRARSGHPVRLSSHRRRCRHRHRPVEQLLMETCNLIKAIVCENQQIMLMARHPKETSVDASIGCGVSKPGLRHAGLFSEYYLSMRRYRRYNGTRTPNPETFGRNLFDLYSNIKSNFSFHCVNTF